MALDFSKSNNASNLKKIQKKSNENSNSVVAIDIDLSLIDKNEDNEKIFSMTEIEYLAKGIKDEGFFGAIEVYKKPDGRYEISAGHRRYEAMKYLKRTSIPCIVKDIPDDFTRGKKLLSSNMRNRKLTPMDMARALEYYEQILTQSGQKKNFKKQASEFFNISESEIYRYQCLNRIIPELQDLTNRPNFPYSALREAAGLSVAGQEELYKKLIAFMDENTDPDNGDVGITRPRIETLIRQIREKEEYQAKPHLEANKRLVEIAKKREENRQKAQEIDNSSTYFEAFDDMIKDYSQESQDIEVYAEKRKKTTVSKADKEKTKELIQEIDKIQEIINGLTAMERSSAESCITIFENLIEDIRIKSS